MAQILLSATAKKDGFHPSTNPKIKLVFHNQAQFSTTICHILALFSPKKKTKKPKNSVWLRMGIIYQTTKSFFAIVTN